jgi:Flp pilus assembly pilin Flp
MARRPQKAWERRESGRLACALLGGKRAAPLLRHARNRTSTLADERKPFPMKLRTQKRMRDILRDTRGANMVEYIIIVGLVAFIAILGFQRFGGAISAKVNGQSNDIGNLPQ